MTVERARATESAVDAGGDLVRGRYVLLVAVPEPGIGGGLREVAARPFLVDRAVLAERVAGLDAWARAELVAGQVPLGLYIAECQLDRGPDDDPEGVATRTYAWQDLGEWPMAPWTHPTAW